MDVPELVKKLPISERRKVVAAVRRGDPAPNGDLVSATIAMARWSQDQLRNLRPAAVVKKVNTWVFSLAVALVGYLGGGVPAAIGGPSALVIVYLVGYGVAWSLMSKASRCEARTKRKYRA